MILKLILKNIIYTHYLKKLNANFIVIYSYLQYFLIDKKNLFIDFEIRLYILIDYKSNNYNLIWVIINWLPKVY